LALKPGDAVYVQRFQRQGRVVRVNAGKKMVVVDAGLLEVEVPFDGLARPPVRVERPRPPRKAAPAPAPAVGAPVAEAGGVAPPDKGGTAEATKHADVPPPMPADDAGATAAGPEPVA
jgi:hypothetical protein